MDSEKILKLINSLGIPFLLLLFPFLTLAAQFLGFEKVWLPGVGEIGETKHVFRIMFFLGSLIWFPKVIIDCILSYNNIELKKEEIKTQKLQQQLAQEEIHSKQEEHRSKQIDNINKLSETKGTSIKQYKTLFGSESTSNT